ncbi:MAG: DUF5606 domain-containing protein [Muribaculaceae bacterium]|nr:DUF5606 domain-containing protein [Muribaculaceae bacterium]
MLKRILSISGRPGLFRLVNQGKNMLIVESLATGKRVPAYAHDKVISLGDVSMYTTEDDIQLGDVLTNLFNKAEGKPVDIKGLGGDKEIRAFFKEVLPNFDEERVYTADIKKLFTWYNQLIAAGFTSFVEAGTESEKTAEE